MRTFKREIGSLLAAVMGLLPLMVGGCGDDGTRAAEDSVGSTGTTTGGHEPGPTSSPPPPTTGTEGTATSTTGDPTTGGAGGTTLAPDDCTLKRSEVAASLGTACAGCHSGPGAQVYDYVDDLDRLVAEGKIVAGDPEGSPLYQKIDAGLMPPGDLTKLTVDEKQGLYDWIEQCTDQPGECGPFISTAEMIDRMLMTLSDFDEVAVDDQPFIRFFTLTHLYNAGICGAQLDLYRHALAKLLNSLSRDLDIHPLRGLPDSVDPEDTIYMIDLRDYGWEAKDTLSDVWDLLVDRNPFAVQYELKNALQLRKLTLTPVPFQMGDWFITDAASAPLYDEIVYERVFPVTADIDAMTRFELEALLGIDVTASIAAQVADGTGDVIRAGFLESGVSDQNRVIERHASPLISGHSYWLSHDFLNNIGLSSILAHPLDFVAAGGEVIWTLPNGLQAYLLVDDVGKRINEADINIVHNKEQGGDTIVNGVSCMGCHSSGMRSAADEVWPYVKGAVGEFSELQKQQVERLYPLAPALEEAIDADIALFIERLKITGAPPLHQGIEVIQGVHNAFEDPPVDLTRAAAELGLLPEELSAGLGFVPKLLALKTTTVDRETMRAEFANAVCKLLIGKTKACP